MSFEDVYLKLCSLSVFSSVLKKPLFKKFFEFAQAEGISRIKAYGLFVAQIYEDGANLTNAVRKIVFEDENVYVRAIALKKEINKNIESSAKNDLEALSYFASMTPDDMGAQKGWACFDSECVDLNKEYHDRINNIGKYGYGIFASHAMLSISDTGEIEPIESADRISLDSFIGYEAERKRVYDNTKAFIDGRPAANVLLYGDAGTGKSSSVKAIVNHFFDDGLRLIEIRKNQLLLLPKIMAKIGKNPLKFIIFIDDLSFNKNDDNFSMLKATLEGSASARAENAIIYATSNRRHIVKETFSDREGNDIHRNDTVQENLSLSERFGLTVMFAKPDKKLYLEIVHELAERCGIAYDKEKLETQAEAFALQRGYRSARCAEQFIKSLM